MSVVKADITKVKLKDTCHICMLILNGTMITKLISRSYFLHKKNDPKELSFQTLQTTK